MATVVFSGVAAETAGLQGTLFQGLKFWLAQRVPQRSRFVADVKANGGDVVPLDKQADIRIVDHARKETLPGTHSYTFIEKSLRSGSLENLEDHVVGPRAGTVRSIGSTTQPAKGSRNRFTQDDDRILWHWVQNNPQKYGGTDGNEIYKQLEAQDSRHPWQSWRDRWIKQLKGKPRPAFIPADAPPTPASDHLPPQDDLEMRRNEREETVTFSDIDKEALLKVGEDIHNICSEDIAAAWEKWATDYDFDGSHSAQEWRNLWEHEIRPIYLKKRAKEVLRPTSIGANPQGRPAISPERMVTRTNTKPPPNDNSGLHECSSENLSYRTPSPKTYHRSSSLSVRTPQRLQETVKTDIPGSDQPELEKEDDGHWEDDEYTLFLPVPEPSTPSLPPEPRNGGKGSCSRSSKRKRDVFDDDELPSSSPPYSAQPLPLSIKRQRQAELKSGLLEIASTPENSPIRQGLNVESQIMSHKRNGIFDELDKDLSEDGSSGEYSCSESQTNPVGRQVSPTLSSPTRAVSETQTGTTQAVFKDATQFIDVEVPSPDEGWGDEDIQDEVIQGGDVRDEDIREKEMHENLTDEDVNNTFNLEPDPNAQLLDFNHDETISETQCTVTDTQGLLDSRTQTPNLDVADPEDGWGSIGGMLSSSPREAQPTLPDTQNLLYSKTQMPELDVPEPDGGWDSLGIGPSSAASTPAPRSSPPPIAPVDQEAPDEDDVMEVWTTSKIALRYPVADIHKALYVTGTDDFSLADYALWFMSGQGKGQIPPNKPGIWTEEDDADLHSIDTRKVQRVHEKHGVPRCNSRLQFLILYGPREQE